MRICLLTDTPDHPLLAGAAALLSPPHQVTSLDPDDPALVRSGPPRLWDLADVYLLKAYTPRALALAGELERRGALVLNTVTATALCQDRARTACRARSAGLPFLPTRAWTSVAALAERAGTLRYPLVAKSRRNRRDDLVARLDDADQVRHLAGGPWRSEPVVTQEFAPNDGWDRKVWVIGGRVFAALRPSPLGTPPRDSRAAGGDATPPGHPRTELGALARRVGDAFQLDVFGVDFLDRDAGPVIVDVNAFPGVRGQQGAPEALAALVLRRTQRRRTAG